MLPLSRYNHKLLLVIIAAGIFSFLTSLLLLQVFFGILIILWLTEKNTEKKKAFDTVGLLLLVFMAARLLSIFLSPHPDIAYQALYKDALFFLGFFAFSFYFRALSEDEMKYVFIFLLISFSASALLGLLRFNTGDVNRAETFSSGYTTYSSYLLAASGIVMAYSKTLLAGQKILFPLVMSILYTGIITSLGRFNIIAALFLFIAGIIIFRLGFKNVVLILLFTGVFTSISFYNNSSEAQKRIDQPVQLSDRDVIFEGALLLWKERPLTGYGPRTFREIFPLHEKLGDKGVGSWHNDFIQVYFESGLIGLGAFIVLLVYLVPGGIWYIFKYKPKNIYIISGIILALTGIILSSLTAGFINSPVLAVFFAILAALFSAIKSKELLSEGNSYGN
jgi:O-antigen ligase